MNPLWSNVFRRAPQRGSLADFLGRSPFFSDLSARELARLEQIVHPRVFAAGDQIFAEGDHGSGMYLIRSGRVKIHTGGSDVEEEELALLGPDDFFGETALALPAPRAATATALENSELIGFFRGDLEDITQRLPVLSCKILHGLNRVLSQRLELLAASRFQEEVLLSPHGPGRED